MFSSTNPYTGQTFFQRESWNSPTLKTVLDRAADSQREWQKLTLESRAKCLLDFAQRINQEEAAAAATIREEMGKLEKEALAEIRKAERLVEYYARSAPDILSPRRLEQGEVVYMPLGIILGVMPWNFPFWQVLRAAIPAMLAGNAFVWKPAPSVPLSSELLEKLARESQLPPDLFQALWIEPDQVPEVLEHPSVAMVTFTGSSTTGRKIGAMAGGALKKSLLELGGSDPFIVLEDADIEAAAEAALHSRFGNAGQTCIAAKRFIVCEPIADAFVLALQHKMSHLQAGTNLAPLARADLRTHLHQQVQSSLSQGAKCLLGGELPAGPGYFYPATLLDCVHTSHRTAQEEVFGPVASIIRVHDAAEAVTVANDTRYGLSASVWSQDLRRAREIADQIQSGSVYLNRLSRSDLALPFGGIKESGYGRELGPEGILEFVNIRAIHHPIQPK